MLVNVSSRRASGRLRGERRHLLGVLLHGNSVAVGPLGRDGGRPLSVCSLRGGGLIVLRGKL